MSDKNGGYDFDSEDDDIFGEDPFGSAASESTEGAEGPLDGDQDAFGGLDEQAAPKSNQGAQPDRPKAKSSLFSMDGMIDFLKENVIYIVGGIVVLIVVYYLFFDLIFTSPAKPQPRPQAQQQSQGFGVTTQVAKVGQQQQAQQAQQQQANAMAFNKADLKQLVDGFTKVVQDRTTNLENQIKQIQTSDKSLQSGQSTLATSMAGDQKELKNITTQINALNTSLQTFNKSIADITNNLKTTQSQLKLLLAQKTEARDQLTLRAVVPGRAWLVDKDGKTVTVTVGTMIQNYGKVEKIDSKSGSVVMSSGYVFN